LWKIGRATTFSSAQGSNIMTRLLIIDEDAAIQDMLRDALAPEGFETLVATEAQQALDWAHEVDVVLANLANPRLDSLELVIELKRRKPSLPIAVTAEADARARALSAIRHGAYACVIKPYGSEEIISQLKLGLRLGNQEKELLERNLALESMRRELEVANRQLREANARLEEKNEALEHLASTDALTGLANRRRFMERLREELSLSNRYERPLSLLMLDLDRFKSINDTFGHSTGDEVLRSVSNIIHRRARETDVVGRIGGEEFAVLLPSTTLAGAMEVAESIRTRVAQADPASTHGVTLSGGVAQHYGRRPAQDGESSLLIRADRALYRAKDLGRNRIEVSPGDDEAATENAHLEA
jgi:diguanylate cyclase (GGDEF)-like protein